MFKKNYNLPNLSFAVKNAFHEIENALQSKSNFLKLKIVKISKILKMSLEWF